MSVIYLPQNQNFNWDEMLKVYQGAEEKKRMGALQQLQLMKELGGTADENQIGEMERAMYVPQGTLMNLMTPEMAPGAPPTMMGPEGTPIEAQGPPVSVLTGKYRMTSAQERETGGFAQRAKIQTGEHLAQAEGMIPIKVREGEALTPVEINRAKKMIEEVTYPHEERLARMRNELTLEHEKQKRLIESDPKYQTPTERAKINEMNAHANYLNSYGNYLTEMKDSVSMGRLSLEAARAQIAEANKLVFTIDPNTKKEKPVFFDTRRKKDENGNETDEYISKETQSTVDAIRAMGLEPMVVKSDGQTVAEKYFKGKDGMIVPALKEEHRKMLEKAAVSHSTKTKTAGPGAAKGPVTQPQGTPLKAGGEGKAKPPIQVGNELITEYEWVDDSHVKDIKGRTIKVK